MIEEFSVQNFLSFQEKQTISFVATPDKTHLDELTIEPKPGMRLLKMAIIYGANASGKSNLLLAMQALWQLLFNPHLKENERIGQYQPFTLTKGDPSQFAITFWVNNRRFKYQILYNDFAVIHEKMEYTTDFGVLSDMYERRTGQPIVFGSTINIKAKQRDELNRETLRNHTVLSTLNKKNIDVPSIFQEVYTWTKSKINEIGTHNDLTEIAEFAERNAALKQLIINLLNKADFNITDFNTVAIEPTFPTNSSDNDSINHILNELSKKQKFTRKEILFTHTTAGGNFQISSNLESAGTKAYFRLARLLFDLRNDCVIMEDELDDSLHYDLLIHYLQTFLQTGSSHSQLIFASHNQLILKEEWMIRRDMVWFVEKDRETASSLVYRASDMGLHKNVSIFNAYRIGKLGAKPILGSTF